MKRLDGHKAIVYDVKRNKINKKINNNNNIQIQSLFYIL